MSEWKGRLLVQGFKQLEGKGDVAHKNQWSWLVITTLDSWGRDSEKLTVLSKEANATMSSLVISCKGRADR